MPKKPVIAFVLPDLTAGGAEMVLIRLMNALPRKKYTPVFITVSTKGTLRDFISNDTPFHSLDGANVITALPGLYKKLRDVKPDVIVSTMAHMNFAVLVLRPFFMKTKIIVRESTLPDCTLQGRGVTAPLIRLLYFILYPLADRIIAPAGIILEKMSAQLKISMNRAIVLPNPVDTSKIKISTSVSNPGDPVRFIAAGRLHPEKGFDRLIKALKDYRGGPWRLTILGEGEQRGQLEYMIEALKFREKISFPGFRIEPWKDFAEADCFLLPSRWEGLPNAALESLACGTPVIAMQEAGGIVEIAAASPPGSVTLASTMPEFLKAMEKVKSISKTKTLLPAAFEKETVIKNFEKILDEISS